MFKAILKNREVDVCGKQKCTLLPNRVTGERLSAISCWSLHACGSWLGIVQQTQDVCRKAAFSQRSLSHPSHKAITECNNICSCVNCIYEWAKSRLARNFDFLHTGILLYVCMCLLSPLFWATSPIIPSPNDLMNGGSLQGRICTRDKCQRFYFQNNSSSHPNK